MMNTSIRNGFLASIAALSLAAALPQAVDAASLHGAIAYSPTTGSYGTGTGWSASHIWYTARRDDQVKSYVGLPVKPSQPGHPSPKGR